MPLPFLGFLTSAASSGGKPTGNPVFCLALNCFPLLSYSGISSCGIYPSFTLLGFLHVPSGLCVAGINFAPEILFF